jgi:hypothetical protein
MLGKTYRKLLSAMLASAMAFGLMVVIVNEGPTEMPYYDGSTKNPVTSPNVEAIYYSNTQAAPTQTVETAQPVATPNVAYQTKAEYSSYSSYTSRAE